MSTGFDDAITVIPASMIIACYLPSHEDMARYVCAKYPGRFAAARFVALMS